MISISSRALALGEIIFLFSLPLNPHSPFSCGLYRLRPNVDFVFCINEKEKPVFILCFSKIALRFRIFILFRRSGSVVTASEMEYPPYNAMTETKKRNQFSARFLRIKFAFSMD